MQDPLDVVERREAFARAGAAHDELALQLVEVVGVQRLTGGEHDVVRHVDGQGDGPHPDLAQAVGDEGRRRGGRVDAPHDAGDEAVAPDGTPHGGVVLEPDGVPRTGRSGTSTARGSRSTSATGCRVPWAYSRAIPRMLKQ